MVTPKRIQRRRTKGHKMPKGAKYVGRPGPYGNPFKVGALVMDLGPYASPACPYEGFVEPGFYQWTGLGGPYAYEIRRGLGGRDLACWCKVGDPCHGDVWIFLANGAPDA